MANEQNLRPIQKGQLSKEELKKRQSAGGKRSGEVRREKKLWKEEITKRLNAKDWDDIMDTLIRNAKVNGGKDFEILRDTMGQKPKEEEVEKENVQRVQIVNDLPRDDVNADN